MLWAISVEGVDLTDNYSSAAIDSMFPYDAPVDLELVTFRPTSYNSLLSKKEIAAGWVYFVLASLQS